jgi:hypothetical protein
VATSYLDGWFCLLCPSNLWEGDSAATRSFCFVARLLSVQVIISWLSTMLILERLRLEKCTQENDLHWWIAPNLLVPRVFYDFTFEDLTDLGRYKRCGELLLQSCLYTPTSKNYEARLTENLLISQRNPPVPTK